MKKTLVFLLLLFSSFQVFGQSKCDLKALYNDFIKIEKYENRYLVKRVVKTEAKNCYTAILNDNIHLFSYILTNFSSNENYNKLFAIQDSIALQKAYIKDLQIDTLFNPLMQEYANKVIDKKMPKDSISSDYLLNIAVKYFSIMKINENDDYVGKVCVGLHDIKKTEKKRSPFVEAFCFSSIFKHYQGEEFNMYEEFVKALRELYTVNLGIEKAEKLLRAQGGMFLLMRNNANLKKMLHLEYERKKDVLPFILKD